MGKPTKIFRGWFERYGKNRRRGPRLAETNDIVITKEEELLGQWRAYQRGRNDMMSELGIEKPKTGYTKEEMKEHERKWANG